MNKIILSLSFLLLQLFAHAQGLESHLPLYAQYVITLNTQNYSGKADMNEVSKMEFFSSLQKESKSPERVSAMLAHILAKPSDCGVLLLPRAYLFRMDHDSVTGWVYLFSLKDQNAFGKFLKTAFAEEGNPEMKITAVNGYNTGNSGRMTATWTNDFAMILVRDSYDSYSYTDNYIEKANTSQYSATEDSLKMVLALKLAIEKAKEDSIVAAREMAERQLKEKNKKPLKKGAHPAQARLTKEQQAAAADSIAAVEQAANVNAYSAERSGGNDWEAQNKERELNADIRKQERCAKRLKELMNLPPAQSVLKIKTFTESQKENFDIAFWMNYSGDAFPGLNPFGNKKHYSDSQQAKDTSNALLDLVKDNYSVAYCTFDNGKINLQHRVYVNPEVDNLIDGLYKKKGDKDFVKYIKGTNLMGYASMSVNVEKTLKASKKILTKTYEATMGENAKYITGIMDIYSVFSNDDVVYNLFKGDFALAITDFRTFKTSFTAYKYDDNFVRTESKEEKNEVLPEFVAMASIGKPEEMKKILKAVEKMGGIKQEGAGVYRILFPHQGDYQIFIALENNILFCTNNDELVHGKLKSGYPKKEQMTSDQKNILCNNPVAYYWNGTKTFEMIDKQPEFQKEAKMVKNLKLLKENVKDASITGVTKQNNAYVTNMSMNFTDSSMNSLMHVFKMINSLYLLDK